LVNGERASVNAIETEEKMLVLEDDRSWVDDEEDDKLLEDDDENDEDVVVEDPSVLIDVVARFTTYFRNTACPEGVY
jgi:hypothetical protein